MANKNQPRRPNARVAAALRAKQRQKRQRLIVSIASLAIVLAIVAALLGSTLGSDSASPTTTTSSTVAPSTTAPANSVKGKPCVKLADPLPSGAPAVPVEVGPPPTALVKTDLKAGTGAVVTAEQTVAVDYIGVSCSTGKIFDTSYKDGGQPYETKLDAVIAGWTQGIPGMKVGGSRLLGIPPDLAYGSQGSAPDIAPDETLWFVVTIVSAK